MSERSRGAVEELLADLVLLFFQLRIIKVWMLRKPDVPLNADILTF